MAIKAEVKEEVTPEVKGKKKYKVIALDRADAKNGFHICNVNGLRYDIPINKEVELPDAVISYLTNAKAFKHIPVTDNEDGIDIEKENFPIEVSERFQVSEV